MTKTEELLDVFTAGVSKIIPPAKFECLLAFGGPGTGKTHFALTASELEEYSPVLVIDTESSTPGVIDNFRQRDPNNPTDIAFDPEKGGGIIDVVNPIQQWGPTAYVNTLKLLDAVADGKTIYKTVIIDVADVLLGWGLAHHEDPRNKFARWEQVDLDLTSAPVPSKVSGGRNLGLFYRLKMSDVFTILVVHERKKATDDGESEIIDFQWSGQGLGKLGGIPDSVLRFERRMKNGKPTVTVHTVGGVNFPSKTRFNLPNQMTDVSLKDVLETARKNKEN